jgi:hypothetical protein
MNEPSPAPARVPDAEDLSTCASCGFQTAEALASCPKCGTNLLTRRWTRRYGAVLVFIGAFLALMMGGILWMMLPTLLHPGVEIDGQTFTGTPGFARGVIAGLGSIMLFGVAACAYGVWQVRTGERNLTVVSLLVGFVGVLYVIALLIRNSGS